MQYKESGSRHRASDGKSQQPSFLERATQLHAPAEFTGNSLTHPICIVPEWLRELPVRRRFTARTAFLAHPVGVTVSDRGLAGTAQTEHLKHFPNRVDATARVEEARGSQWEVMYIGQRDAKCMFEGMLEPMAVQLRVIILASLTNQDQRRAVVFRDWELNALLK